MIRALVPSCLFTRRNVSLPFPPSQVSFTLTVEHLQLAALPLAAFLSPLGMSLQLPCFCALHMHQSNLVLPLSLLVETALFWPFPLQMLVFIYPPGSLFREKRNPTKAEDASQQESQCLRGFATGSGRAGHWAQVQVILHRTGAAPWDTNLHPSYDIWDLQDLAFTCRAACSSEQSLLLFTAAFPTQKDSIALAIELGLSVVLNFALVYRSVLSDSSSLLWA